MRRLLIACLAGTAAVLLVPASGQASLPKAKDRLIEVPSSIGGVELKQTIKKADRTWGRTGECDLESDIRSCRYVAANARAGRARIDAAVQGQVSSFEIVAGRDEEGGFVFQGRLLRFETKQGIGLGDRGKRILDAYPDAIRTANDTGYIIEGRGRSYMTVQTLDGKHITTISVVDGMHQG